MKNKIYSLLASLLVVVGFSSCNEKWEPDTLTKGETGWLSTNDLSVDLSNAEEIISSRAAVDLSNFIVTITNENGVTVSQWTYAEMPSLPAFTVGNYTLKIESGQSVKADWEAPYFSGTKDFTILKDQIVNAGTVKCTLQNLKVSVRFTPELIAASEGDLSCEIRVNEDGVLKFTHTETRSAYFEVIPGNTTMVATFTGTVNGYKEEIIRLYKDLQAGQHRIITFSLKGADVEVPVESGTIDPTGGLNVDLWVDDVDLNGNVNTGGEDVIPGDRPGGEEWPEEPDDPNDPVVDPTDNQIEFKSDYLDLSNGNRNKASEFGLEDDGLKPAVVKILAPEGIAHLNVTIDSQSLDVTDVGLRNSFDLAYPGDLETALGPDGLQFPINDAVLNQTEVTFDISQFVPMLAFPMFPGQHNFIIEVIDNTNNSKTLKLTFINE